MRLRSLLKYARVRYLRTCRQGFCPFCSRRTLFLMMDSPETVRNHALCLRCRSYSRQRHIALCVLRLFAERGISRYSDFRNRPDIRVFDTSSTGWLARKMDGAPNITVSEYFDDVPPGEHKNGILCQDLQRLTFAESSFDLVVSEDVMEHIPDYRRAFREIYRVLKPGGAHVFSIPFYGDRRTRELFEWKDGAPALFEPIEYHGDPIRGGIPCYTHLGYDLLDFLGETGFETRIEISRFAESNRFGTFDSFTFISRKPAT